MSEKGGRTIIRIEKECHRKLVVRASKEGKELIQVLREHTQIHNLEGMIEVTDNVEIVAREHPELIDHSTPVEELLDQWEDSLGETFVKCEAPRGSGPDNLVEDEEIILVKD